MTPRLVSIFVIFYIAYIDKCVTLATSTPPRGSVEFIKYAYNVTGTPRYWTSQNNFGIVVVDNETKAAIIKLVSNTFQKDLLGKGISHRYLSHTYLNVINVKRIENPSVFAKYNTRRKEMLLSRFSGIAEEVSSLKGSRGPVFTTKLLSPSMKDAIYTEVNEHYFFHGTHVNNVDSIANNGFLIDRSVPHGTIFSIGSGFLINRVLAHGTDFGLGIYGVETSQKADNYAFSTSDVFNLLLFRMTLGNIYSCTNNSQRRDILKGHLPPNGYDSVMSNFDEGDSTKLGVFREYIVYSEDQAYPEYIIEYTRSSSANKDVVSFVKIVFACYSLIITMLSS